MNANDVQILSAVGTIIAAFCGPIAAVVITLVAESRRRYRQQQETVLQTLLATRGRHADANYSWAIRMVPIFFSKSKSIVLAHAEYMNAVRHEPPPEQRATADIECARRQGILISEILQELGYRGLSSEQLEAYTAQGLVDREELIIQALKSIPYLAFSAKRSADAAETLVSSAIDNKTSVEG